MVEVEGARSLMRHALCPQVTAWWFLTNTERVRNARRIILEMLMTQGHHNCITCESSGDCVLQDLAL